MKEGEEEKTKTYSALIWTDKAIQREDITFLDDIKVAGALVAHLNCTCPGALGKSQIQAIHGPISCFVLVFWFLNQGFSCLQGFPHRLCFLRKSLQQDRGGGCQQRQQILVESSPSRRSDPGRGGNLAPAPLFLLQIVSYVSERSRKALLFCSKDVIPQLQHFGGGNVYVRVQRGLRKAQHVQE